MLTAPQVESRKPLVWLHGRVKTPPFTKQGRVEAGILLGLLQAGKTLSMPHSRPLPAVGPRCAELRIRDAEHNWRIIYRIDQDAVIVVDVFAKKTQQLSNETIRQCRQRLRDYDKASREEDAR